MAKIQLSIRNPGLSGIQENVFTFGGAKRSGSDRECKYFPIGMNAREPLWR